MLAVNGIYQNGIVKLDETLPVTHAIKVIVTFLEEIEIEENKKLNFSDFSFSKSRQASNKFKGSISDSIIEERRKDV